MNKQAKFGIVGIVLVILIIGLAVVAHSYLSVQKIEDIKTSEKIGDNVRVHGEVKSVIKIGGLSGYTIEDSSGSIAVSSEELPKEGSTITVSGTLIKDSIFGYYIKVN